MRGMPGARIGIDVGGTFTDLVAVDGERVVTAIENGGTGQGRMPAGLLRGQDAEAVAAYVARVAGQ